jgi:hypothetical protein
MADYVSEEDWIAKESAVKNRLAIAYGEGLIDVQDPVDANLSKLANALVRVVIQAQHLEVVKMQFNYNFD